MLWQEHAACKGMDANIFFPETAGQGKLRRALKICRTCPVIEDCASSAFINNEQYGVWGGQSCRKRRQQRRQVLVPNMAVCVCCKCDYRPVRVGQKTCSRKCSEKSRYRLQTERRETQRSA